MSGRPRRGEGVAETVHLALKGCVYLCVHSVCVRAEKEMEGYGGWLDKIDWIDCTYPTGSERWPCNILLCLLRRSSAPCMTKEEIALLIIASSE